MNYVVCIIPYLKTKALLVAIDLDFARHLFPMKQLFSKGKHQAALALRAWDLENPGDRCERSSRYFHRRDSDNLHNC